MDNKLDLIKGAVSSVAQPNEKELSNMGTFIGEALDDDAKINLINAKQKPEVTVLVGFVGYGKTSFVASCYHTLLTTGGIGGFTFFDSDTLVGLERRLYLRRCSEQNIDLVPETKRTLRGEPYLLTFRLSHPEEGEKVVVFSDHSGEDYQEYKDKKAKLDTDVLLRNADRLLFFVDCQKLLSQDYLTMRSQYLQLIQNMKEYSCIRDTARIQFVFNKYDLVAGKENSYQKRKESFLTDMSALVGRELTVNPQIVSNQVQNNESVLALLQDIVTNTIVEDNNQTNVSNELDWVKDMLRK